MLSNEVSVQFRGFHPSDFTRSFIDIMVQELRDESPYGATLKGYFSRQGHLFNGRIAIYSPAGRFFSHASGRKLKDVVHELVRQIRRQLNHWKSERFGRERLTESLLRKNDQPKEGSYDTDNVA